MGDLWDEAVELARQRRESMSELVRRAIEREVRRLRRGAK
jgi:post-segregation antitoxin (ccd killing protein)